MRIVKKWAVAAIGVGVLAFAPILGAQEVGAPPLPPKPKTVEISPNGIEVQVGQKLQFTSVAKDDAGKVMDLKPMVWFAAPFDVAGADQQGVVVFHEPGDVTVGAYVGGKLWYAHVTVVTPPPAKLDIAAISHSLPVGASAVLSATARSANGDPRSDVAIHWKSTTPAIAKVNDSGLVTALAPGIAKFEATSGPASAQTSLTVVLDTTQRVSIEPATAAARTGDVVHFKSKPRFGKGGEVKGVLTTWSVSGPRATIYPDGAFVAEMPGTYEVTATVGRHTAVATVTVAPRNIEREVDIVSRIPTKDADGKAIQTSEEWIIGNHLYYSTISDKLYLYDISDPAHPKLLDSMKADARLINDLSTTPDEKIGVFTREGASNRKNGIVFFDPSDPAHLKVISEYTETVTGGVHSAFINTHYAYITDDATGSLRIIDFQDVQHPKEVARWQTENPTAAMIGGPMGPTSSGRYLHDLYVKDGLAYLAYWRDGLIILDVGSGIKGGSPEHPQLVAQFKYNHYELYGNGWLAGTHSAFRYKNYLFIGDEVFPAQFDIDSPERIPVRGVCHVMDISDIEHPREVANYEIPEGGMHNFWADNDMLLAGDYAGGGRVLDISGELRGNLYEQGREIGRIWTGAPDGYRPNLPFAWGGQPANGLIFFNDVHTGIWIAKLGKPRYKGGTTAPPLQEKAQ
ncbi:MAG: Ig-like domain-containing protein [Candidatus Acidiferrales bacterium]